MTDVHVDFGNFFFNYGHEHIDVMITLFEESFKFFGKRIHFLKLFIIERYDLFGFMTAHFVYLIIIKD